MRKSRNKSGFRPLRAGVAVGATAAAVIAGTAIPAYAGTYVLSTSQVAAVTGGTVVHFTGTSTAFDAPASTTDLAVRFITPTTATCPTTYSGTSATTGATTVSAGLATAGSATDAYVTAPAGLVAGTSYALCLYATNSTTNADLAASGGASAVYATDTTATNITAVNMGGLSAPAGIPGDKITVNPGREIYTASSFSTQFVNNAGMTCPTTFSTATSSIVTSATTTKTSSSVLTVTVPTLTAGTAYSVCTYAGSSAGTSALVSRGSMTFGYYGTAALPGMSVAPTGGSSGTTQSVTMSANSPVFTGSPAVLFTRNACPATYAAGATGLEPFAPSVAVSKISTSKIATKVPTSVVVGGLDATSPWFVCAYASNSGALVAMPALYNVAPVLDVSAVQFATAAGSAANTLSGPSQGGQLITVSGLTGIPSAAAVAAGAKLSATLGGKPLGNVTPIDATSFSGVTPPNAAGNVQLSVTTAAGTKTTTAASAGGTRYYTYVYGITVVPNTAATATTPVLDITGAGFSNVTAWGDTATSGAAAANTGYVVLTNNAYYGQTFTNLNVYATAPISYCNGVLPISDSEIICTLNLAQKIDSVAANVPTITDDAAATDDNVAAGTYTVTVVNEGLDIDADEYSVVSSGATFTVAPF